MELRGEVLRRLGELAGPQNIRENTVFPGSAEEVAAVLSLANRERLRVMPIGGGTEQSLGNLAPDPDLVISFTRLNRIKQYEPADLTASMEAGITAAALDDALAPNRQWLPLGVPLPEKATMGGVLATNTSGPFRLFYGTARDMVIGLHFATAEGKLVKTGGMVVKNVAGYDMAKLMIGSLGTLAVITDVNVKVFPRPATETMVLGFNSVTGALEARDAILNSPLTPLAMDLVAPLVESPAPAPFSLAVAYGGVEAVIERVRHVLAAVGTGVVLAGEKEAQFWQRVCDLPATYPVTHPNSVRVKVSTTLQAMRPLLEQAPRAGLVARAGSGITYFYIDDSAVGEIQRLAASVGGHAVVEYAPQAVKKQIDVWGPRRDDYPIMQKLKQAFDPNSILNPGRFVC